MARNWTLSAYAVRTNWIMEQIRQNALKDTIEKCKIECHRYYSMETEGSSREFEKLIRELLDLGMPIDEVYDLEEEIRVQYLDKEV